MKYLILILILFSFTSFGQIPRYQSIVAGEYFINTDPGEGQAYNISGNYNLVDVDINLSNINVPIGSTIYVRFKSSDSIWSPPRGIKRQNYFVNSQANLVKAEYYITNDPGLGNGIQADILSGGLIDIIGLSLKRGDQIFIRVKDSFERWSPSKLVKFNYKTLSKAEYYVKLGSGSTTTPQSMIMDQSNDSSFIYSAYQNNIPWQQNDTVFVRFQSEDKFYSNWTKGPLGIPTSIKINNNKTITDYKLEQNYPNPFNPSTTLKYQIPKAGIVTLKVYDILGKEVSHLVHEFKKDGKYDVYFNASNLASGVYIYQIMANDYISSKKMILLK
jgi:hypothetical protein